MLTAIGWLVLCRLVVPKLCQGAEAKAPNAPEPRPSTLRLVLQKAVPPFGLFVWVWVVYAVAKLLLGHWEERTPSFVFVLLRWLRHAGSLAALFWLLFGLISVVERRLQHWAQRTPSKWDNIFAALIVRALRLLTPLVGVILVLPTLPISAESHNLFKQVSSLLLIGAIGFICYELVNTLEQAVLNQFRIDVRDNLAARKIETQVKVLKKIAVVVIGLFTVASMLMVFDSIRHLGASLLASAGVVGVIVGFAAQKSIATVLAGMQIAITQPIRIDDVVIVEGEWGRIEEITLTYVVVLIWDLRRLILPITYFIEKPFQNWTRVSADLLGTVFLYVDYTVPVQELRAELDRILEGHPLWDRKVKGVQVTDTTKDHTIEVRILVSAADASAQWDLRCDVREKLIDFLQRKHPNSLPQLRAEWRFPEKKDNSWEDGDQAQFSPISQQQQRAG